MLEAGRPHDLAVIGPCHIRRIEGGILAYGADMWLDTNPYEVGMGYDWMVDLEQKTDFIGKQALARIKREGPSASWRASRSTASLGSYNDGSMIDVFPVHNDGGAIGAVTSACFSPRLEKNIGYAMVPIELADLGTELEVDAPEADASAATVVRCRSSTRRRRRRSRSSRGRRAARTDGCPAGANGERGSTRSRIAGASRLSVLGRPRYKTRPRSSARAGGVPPRRSPGARRVRCQ